jgi:hypothetical protein
MRVREQLVGEPLHLDSVGSVARYRDVSVMLNRGGRRRHDVEHGGRPLEKRSHRIAGGAELFDQRLANREEAVRTLEARDLGERPEQTRHLAGEHLERLAKRVRQAPRSSVRARDHSDEFVADDEREGERRGLTHVPHELGVVERDAPQLGAREIEWLPRRRAFRGNHGDRTHPRQGDRSRQLGEVELARLGRDVRSRVVKPQVGFHRLVGSFLGHDLSVVIRVEVVDHHTIESSQPVQLAGRFRPELLPGARATEPVHRGIHLRYGGEVIARQCRLELHHGNTVDGVDDRVEVSRVAANGDGIRGAACSGEYRGQALDRGVADQLRQRGSHKLFRGTPEDPGAVLARLQDGPARSLGAEEHAVGLDRSGATNGLADARRHACSFLR